ncbi:lysophospholipid acyltransferase family protein [Mucilaginibacter myungsuensis]|uniref:1-acyl-sn-glycerol-3-phosphate acyltransferase n=1 Tax=Mucilaginibacter myungsuensis TaxID=649104 RepID=A0A929L3K7_9SPHI|nr:lysophospholipid acyltransferase family protein [Mucilaginibacter myungsuensis]MBE9663405.1 1-acyl-sn-glycerol-3-phosphate acyltransferase [Mucilaginibacter myungsuensis]MDN3600142.1 lysophospholipid acyltransferase family protein [Mucilaginibacter myungsuensis]
MKKFFGYILTPIHYVAFFVLLCIFHPIQWICFNLFGYKAHKASVDLLNFFLTGTLYLLGNVPTFVNKQNLPIGRPIIFMANHQSTHDIPALIWHLRKYHAKFISKIELVKMNIPSVSYNLKKGGGANIDRKDNRQSIGELVKLGTRMHENKWSAVIFPEGTRGKDGKVKMFQAGGMGALLKKCPEALVVPVAISNYSSMLKWGFYPLEAFTPIRFEVLEPIEPGTMLPNDLALLAENKVKRALGQM